MLTFFHPSFEGVYEPKRPTADFMGRMADRVRSAGLFPTAAERRNRYEVVSQSQTAVRVRSTNLLTGINVGLNDIALATVDGGRGIRYTVSFWTWAKYSLALSGIIGIAIGVVFCLPIVFEDGNPFTDYSAALILAAAIPMALFWGGLFPWLHIAVHRRYARKCLIRILDEISDPGDAERADGP
jgi:hypothetical protein